MRVLKNIIRYPIKGFVGEFLKEVELNTASTIFGDRKFAFARYNTNLDQKSPIYMKKTNFLALVKDSKLALLDFSLDFKEDYLKLLFKKKKCFEGSLNDENDLNRLSDFMCKYLNLKLNEKPKLVVDKTQRNENLKHSFSDIPDKAISLINFETIKAFEKKINKKIDYLRFRGNFNFIGGSPWEEFKWIGKKLKIGTAELKVFKRTQRCRATTVNPKNGKRDINVPLELNKHYGHFDLGVYCKVIKHGIVKINDEVNIIK